MRIWRIKAVGTEGRAFLDVAFGDFLSGFGGSIEVPPCPFAGRSGEAGSPVWPRTFHSLRIQSCRVQPHMLDIGM
jgi:hypothetical protein